MRPRTLSLAALLIVCALVAFGCGDDDDDGGGGSGDGGSSAYGGKSDGGGAEKKATGNSGGTAAAGQLKLTADPGGALKFDKTPLSTKPGKVTVVLDNPSQVPHAVELEGKDVEAESETVTNGVSKLTADLKPGKYEFYCPVDGHRAAGMEGTLTVG
jgi:uncharacterized cupredoxin-like copper-binding protein